MPIFDFDYEREKLDRKARELYAKANIELSFCGISKETYIERVEKVKEWHYRHLEVLDEMEKNIPVSDFVSKGDPWENIPTCTCPKYRLGVCRGCKQREFREDLADAELRGDC